MPGIAGIISDKSPEECQRELDAMLASMMAEPFYAVRRHAEPSFGVYSGDVALNRTASKPRVTRDPDGAVTGVVVGELQCSTVKTGTHEQHSSLLSASLCESYEKFGASVFSDLNGRFSGLLFDRRRSRALVFNDRYGMERIYYHEARDGFYFASEAKALLRVLDSCRAFDKDGLLDYLQYGCTLDNRTLFCGIRLLPAGSLWVFEPRTVNKQRYFVAATWEEQSLLSPEAFETQFEETFRAILPPYFNGDGPVGISLTGGLDTRLIMACRPSTPHAPVAYTFAGFEDETLDARIAAKVAAACGMTHSIVRLGRDFFRDFPILADRAVHVTDGTYSVSGAHEIYLNRLARAAAHVRLTGNFGSEVLRGLSTFKPLNLTAALLEEGMRYELLTRPDVSPSRDAHPISFAVFKEIPWRLSGVVKAAESQIVWRTPYLDNRLVGLAYKAPRTLRQSSHVAAAVIRRSSVALSRIATDRGLVPASRLRSALLPLWYQTAFKLDYWSNEGMPNGLSSVEALFRPLAGAVRAFAPHKYLHYRRWFGSELSGYVRERITDSQIPRRHPWNGAFLQRMAEEHIAGRQNHVQEIDTVLTLEAIDRLLIRQEKPCHPN